MTSEEYLENLRSKFERYFETEDNKDIMGEKIDMFAKFCNISGRTFITMNDVIDRYENYEFCFVKSFDSVHSGDVEGFTGFLKNYIDQCVKPQADHMSTYITGVMLSGRPVEDSTRKQIERFKYSKVFSFYLKGWCDIRLLCIDLEGGNVIASGAAKKLKKVYQLTP